MKNLNLNQVESYLFVSFLTLGALPILYILRYLDNNTLTSWRWVYSGTGGPVTLFIYLIPLLLLAVWLSKSSLPNRYPSIFLFSTGFMTAALLWSVPEMLLDASRYFLEAKHLSENGFIFFWNEWGRGIEPWTDMPLMPLLFGLLFKFFGESRFIVQLLNSLIFALTLVLTCRVGKILWDADTGFHAGLLLLGIPYLPTQAPLLLVDIGTMFFMIFAILCFIKLLRNGGFTWLALSVISLVCALSVKYSTWPMLAILVPVITGIHLQKNPGLILRRALIVGACTTFIYVGLFYGKYDVIRDQLAILGSFQRQGLKSWQEGYLSTFFFQIHPFITLAALYALYRAARSRDLTFLVAACFAAFVFPLQIKRIRYILPMLPFFTLMAAYGINGIRSEPLKRFVSYCAVFSSMVILFGAYKPFLQRTSMSNLQHAGRYIDALPLQAVDVLLLPQHESSGSTAAVLPILDLYTGKQLRLTQAWPVLPPENQEKKLSSLRFTWELDRPPFYPPAVPNRTDITVVISSRENFELPDQALQQKKLTPIKKFSQQAQVFRYRTIVTFLSH
jgi:4-amino-4-deoxy-L-arabinose transferase-like glycosyltransferase